jgi:hypothetical protein
MFIDRLARNFQLRQERNVSVARNRANDGEKLAVL